MPRPSWQRPRTSTALHPVRVGAATVTPVVQFHYRVDPLLFFPDLGPLDPDAWYSRAPYCEDGFLVVDISAFVVHTPEQTLLVDAGVGNGKSRPNRCFDGRADDWPVAPEEIDTVVFTHLHVDHVGFATRFDGSTWVPAFPNARYLTTAAELDYWTGPEADEFRERLGDYVGDSVLPLQAAGVLDAVEPDHRIASGVRLLPAPGHTPGNVCVEIVSEGQRAVFAGDMVHHPLQLAFPELSTDFCVHGGCAAASRQALLRDVADTGTLLFPAHFPDAIRAGSSPIRPAATGTSRWVRDDPRPDHRRRVVRRPAGRVRRPARGRDRRARARPARSGGRAGQPWRRSRGAAARAAVRDGGLGAQVAPVADNRPCPAAAGARRAGLHGPRQLHPQPDPGRGLPHRHRAGGGTAHGDLPADLGAAADAERGGYITTLLRRLAPSVDAFVGSRAVSVVDGDGRLTGAAREALDACAALGLSVGTGHVGLDESTAVVEHCAAIGHHRVLVTHPLHYVDSPAELRRFTDAGALVELAAAPLLHPDGHLHVRDLARTVDVLGPEQLVLSSDVFSRWVPPGAGVPAHDRRAARVPRRGPRRPAPHARREPAAVPRYRSRNRRGSVMTARLDRITPDQMSPEQQEIYAAFTDGRRAAPGAAFSLVHPEGGLIGPPNAWLLSPALARGLESFGGALRFEMELSARPARSRSC